MLYFIDNSQILKNNLYRDGIHLLESGKQILANNFIKFLNCNINCLGFGKLKCTGTCQAKGVNEDIQDENSDGQGDKNSELDLKGQQNFVTKYSSNPLIAYLNINSLSNKIEYLKEVCKQSPIHIICIDETKLDHTFPNCQFKIYGYQYCHGGG